ncbi:MAG: DNA polymerase IV [Actinomycetes bacterium]
MSNSPTKDTSVSALPILHVDLDAFFASVEVLDNPELRGKPVAVGGAGGRGVVASASYEARCRGVYSAMPSVVALRHCPDLIILPGRFSRYEEVSAHFLEILSDFTPVFEPLSLDEAFGDLSSLSRLGVDALEAATELRRRIATEIGVGSGIGLGRNKLFAKLGSKKAKATFEDGVIHEGPGVYIVTPEVEREWLDTLGVRSLWGVGPAMDERLGRLGIRLIKDLRSVEESTLARHVGRAMAKTLVEYAEGIDERPVEADRVNKSIGHEETFAKSVSDVGEIYRHLRRHVAIVTRTMRESEQVARRIGIVVKFDDLTSVSRSHTVPQALDDEDAWASIAIELVDSIPRQGAVRLMGASLSQFAPRSSSSTQMVFDFGVSGAVESTPEEQQLRRESLREALDDIRARFGRSAVGTGIEFHRGQVDVAGQRERHAFGPESTENQ